MKISVLKNPLTTHLNYFFLAAEGPYRIIFLYQRGFFDCVFLLVLIFFAVKYPDYWVVDYNLTEKCGEKIFIIFLTYRLLRHYEYCNLCKWFRKKLFNKNSTASNSLLTSVSSSSSSFNWNISQGCSWLKNLFVFFWLEKFRAPYLDPKAWWPPRA
jgi:hypothetical protein